MTKKQHWSLAVFSLAMSFLFLGICSKSSPLYAMNDWVDVNCFFTVGKGIVHGMLPYRDLLEQKGPILYFIYALAALISETSFIGAWILDALSFGVFLYFSALCARLYLGNSPVIYPITVFLAALLSSIDSAAHGGSTEQFCISFLVMSFYFINRAICENRLLKLWEAFVIGICTGICLYIKFTFLGFFFGLALFVLIWYWRFEKQPQALPAVIGSFFGGIIAVSLPIFLYLLATGTLDEFFTIYFYDNIFRYPLTTHSKLYYYFGYGFISLRDNLRASIILIAGLVWMIVTARKNHKLLTAFLLSEFFLSICILSGGVCFYYYPMIFMALIVYGLVAAVLFLRAKFPALSRLSLKPFAVLGANAALIAVLVVYAYFSSSNTYLIGTPKEEFPQYRFAEQMKETESPTLLNYGFLDGGFYFAADILPTTKYFCKLNVNVDEMYRNQNQLVEQGLVDYVVTRERQLEAYYDIKHCPYTMIDSAQWSVEGAPVTYYLYRKIN